MAYKPANKCRWFSGKNNFDSFFSKFIIYHSFCINLSFDWLWTVLSVGVHMGRHISEHYCLKQAWIKHTFTPTEGETYSKLNFVSVHIVCFHSTICICQGQRLCLCRALSVCGCRWVSMGVESIATEHSMHYVWWVKVSKGEVCVCVCACFNLTNRMFIEYIMCSIFWMKNDSKSTDRIFQLYGVPALMAPANLLYRLIAMSGIQASQ